MTSPALGARIRMAVDLALGADLLEPQGLAGLEAAARALGMSGAEIDAARHWKSFDVQISAALALARAARDNENLADCLQRAERAGIDPAPCRQIVRQCGGTAAGGPRSESGSRALSSRRDWAGPPSP